MSKKARQLRALRSWLGLPQETQEKISDDYEGLFEDFNDCESVISDDNSDDDYEHDYDSDLETNIDSIDNSIDSSNEVNEALLFESYAEESRARIARKFTIGSCYQVVSDKSIIKRLRAGGKYVLQSLTTSGNNPEVGYTFRYLGKQGIHHMFREICGGWSRTYTDAQLVGKEVIEVSENDVIAVNRLLTRSGIRF